MVRSATSLGSGGLSDWLLQRVTAIFMGLYLFGLLGFFVLHPVVDYASWRMLFHYEWMRRITLLFFLSLGIHAWIGMWIVSTDYIKCTVLRVAFQVIVVLVLLDAFIWSIRILWS